MKTIQVTVDLKVDDFSDDENIQNKAQHIVQEMDYTFQYHDGESEIVDTEIVDFNVLDS